MKVIGFRADPSAPRYALVERNGSAYSLLNADGENRLTYPATVEAPSEKAAWLYREIERVFREHSGIARVVIKTNEYTQSDSKAKRESAYAEAMLLLYCAQHQLPIDVKIYTSLGTKSGDVKAHAEERVGRTSKYWDAKMADAVVVAWDGARRP
ncbi:MAG TPA: hypothetical protein VHE09_01935 [Rhizomicrobium sp.]|jgi:hypothetical protein|nr:hypothetical protein [Rhizomicrobium sp.]